jgi:DNA-binding response OmpR family regulator
MNTISGRVLLVSGDIEAGQFWAGLLRHYGAHVTIARSTLQALDAREDTCFDLILIDAYPHLDGVALCRHLRSQAVNPILLLAPCGDETYLLDGYRAGADECMLRPVSPAILLAKVRAWLRHCCTIRAEALDPAEGGTFCLEPSRGQMLVDTGRVASRTKLELRVL